MNKKSTIKFEKSIIFIIIKKIELYIKKKNYRENKSILRIILYKG